MKDRRFKYQSRKFVVLLGIWTIILVGCGASGGDGENGGGDENNAPTAVASADLFVVMVNKQITLDGSKSQDADGDPLTYIWSIDDSPDGSVAKISNTTVVSPTFTPDMSGNYKISLTVNDGITNSVADKIIITAAPLGDIISQEQAEDVLYTAHAGIGYNASSESDDNEFLYDAMFTDPNSLGVNLVIYTIGNTEVAILFANFLVLSSDTPLPVIFNYSDKYITTTMTIRPGNKENYVPFTGTLTANFNESNGYAELENPIFYGENATNEIIGEITGYYKIKKIGGLNDQSEFYFFIRSVDIKIAKGLKAIYTFPIGDIHVDYGNYQINYTIKWGSIDPDSAYIADDPLNLNLLPIDTFRPFLPPEAEEILKNDYRDYTLMGSFDVKGSTPSASYSMSNGLHYRQILKGDDTIVMVDGSLKVPSLTSEILIASPESSNINSINQDSEDGSWDSGEMTITGGNTSVKIELNSDGSANFDDIDNSGLDSWSVDNWQEVLVPVF